MRILLAVDGDQHVGAIHFLLAGRLDVQDGALDDALEAERRLGVDVVLAGDDRCVFVDEVGQILAQRVRLAAAGAQRFSGGRVVDQRQEQMLHRDELVALLSRFDKSHVQADFEFLGDHQFSSMMQASGCWYWRANVPTCSTLVAAISRGKTPHTPRPSL